MLVTLVFLCTVSGFFTIEPSIWSLAQFLFALLPPSCSIAMAIWLRSVLIKLLGLQPEFAWKMALRNNLLFI